jgi:hypothetical protein
MPVTTSSAQKRQRAAEFATSAPPFPTKGNLAVQWDSPFDRLCYLVSTEGMPLKHRAKYESLLKELSEGTGCTEEELIAHGLKVRAKLYFAEEHLGRTGVLASLTGKEQHTYRLPAVLPAF